MSEIERRLRAAMHAAVDDLSPPAGLLEQVRSRRRRRRAATAAAAVFAVGALAVPPVSLALHGRGAAGPGPGAPSIPAPPPVARPAPGTILEACDSAIGMQLGKDWRKQSAHAGPLWFVEARQLDATHDRHSPVAIGGLAVAVPNNTKAWVTTAGAARGYFRFLFGPRDFTDGVDGTYTVANGEAGVTFVGCPAGQGLSSESGYTLYGGYYLIAGSPRQVTLEVWTPASRTPARITLGVRY
jgi:hypothetical protein